MDPHQDGDDETITLATIVGVKDAAYTLRHPDGTESITPTVDLSWMERRTLRRDADGASAQRTAAEGAEGGTVADTGGPEAGADTSASPAESPATPAAPAGARFDLLGQVGKGAMGEVLLVRDRGLWRRVAFKRLLPELATNRGVVARFFSEAQVTAQLDHPNIVPIYELDAGTNHGLGYTMKLVRGETLTKVIARDRAALETHGLRQEPRRLAARLALLLDVCDAIAYAHHKRVIHRDLKPDNIMVGDLGEVYVMDWGIFRLLDGAAGPDLDTDDDTAVTTTGSHGRTQFGAIIGTPAWMSPEQAAGRIPDLGPASDQYALGLILHALVTLRPPRPRDALENTLRRARDGELAPIAREHGRRRVPRELKAIIRRATALDPAARYPDVEALADDVRAYLRGDAVSTQRDTPVQAVARFVAKHKVAAAAALLLLLLAGISVVAAIRVHADQAQAAIEHYLERVDHRVRDAERALQSFEVGVVRLAGQVGVAMASPTPSPPRPVYTSADFDASSVPGQEASDCWVEVQDPSSKPIALSLTAPVVKRSPGVDPVRAGAVDQRLVATTPALQALLRHPSGDGPEATTEDLRACRTPVRRAFATIAAPNLGGAGDARLGVHISLPGVGGYCDDYDGLTRPKYTAVKSPTQDVAWGPSVYPDRYGPWLLASVSAPVLDADGDQVGVAGLELTLTWLIDELLKQPDAPYERAALLLTARGGVIARRRGFDPATLDRLTKDFDPCREGSSQVVSAEDEMAPVALPELLDAIAAQQPAGQIRAEFEDQDSLILYRRLATTGWYYVVVADEGDLP